MVSLFIFTIPCLANQFFFFCNIIPWSTNVEPDDLLDKDVVVTHSEIGDIHGAADCCHFCCQMFTSPVPNCKVEVTLFEPEQDCMVGPHGGIRAEVLFTGVHSSPVDFLWGIPPTGCPIILPITCRFRYVGHRVVQILIAPKIGRLLSHVASLLESDMQRLQTAQMASRKKAVEGLVLAINSFSTSEKTAVFPPQPPLLQGRAGDGSLQSAPHLDSSSTDRSETHVDGTTAIRCGSCRHLLAWANEYLDEDCVIGDDQTVLQNWATFCKGKGQAQLLLDIGTQHERLVPLVGPAGLLRYILERWGRYFDFNVEPKSMDLSNEKGECTLDFTVEGKCQMRVGAFLYGMAIKRDWIRLDSKLVLKFEMPKRTWKGDEASSSENEDQKNEKKNQNQNILRVEKIVRMEFQWSPPPFAVVQQLFSEPEETELPESGGEGRELTSENAAAAEEEERSGGNVVLGDSTSRIFHAIPKALVDEELQRRKELVERLINAVSHGGVELEHFCAGYIPPNMIVYDHQTITEGTQREYRGPTGFVCFLNERFSRVANLTMEVADTQPYKQGKPLGTLLTKINVQIHLREDTSGFYGTPMLTRDIKTEFSMLVSFEDFELPVLEKTSSHLNTNVAGSQLKELRVQYNIVAIWNMVHHDS
jgi:hypothetical protein